MKKKAKEYTGEPERVAKKLTTAEQKVLERETIVGVCPECGGRLVSALAYVGGKGYFVVGMCENGPDMSDAPTCRYRQVLP